MIEELSIHDLGVIEHANLQFGPGLTVLTGETGAGKTMVLTSLGLLLGRRADTQVVRLGTEAAEVDGVFIVEGADVPAFEALGAHVEDGAVIVSRTVRPQGRSRAVVGGRPVPVSTLAERIADMVVIHGQSDQVELRSESTQRKMLDSYGGMMHSALLLAYRSAWTAAVEAKRRRDEATESSEERRLETEMLEQAVAQVEALEVQPGEDDELTDEINRLANVEEIRLDAARALGLLDGEDGIGVLAAIAEAGAALREAARHDGALEPMAASLRSAGLELDAVRGDLTAYLGELDADPARLAALHARKADLTRAMRGRAASSDELLEWLETSRRRLQDLQALDQSPEALEQALLDAQARVLDAGRKLRASRQELGERLSAAVGDELAGLAMTGARFSVELADRKPGPYGTEDVRFLLQPHPDAPARPVSQGASGGELSRIMLALEVVLAGGADARTFVFDEVDAGIGGRTATEVGARLARLARTRQVIVVTHLAQVAAFAQHHLVVSRDGATTEVRAVSGETRIDEIARMIGADVDSDTARHLAHELIEGAAVRESGRD